MRDSEGGVASSTAGGPQGLAEAYDGYADSLYKYCRSLLGDPGDAADAVQDTFVIAASQSGGLPEPGHQDQLRARLYAVARNECLRAVRGGKTAAAADVTGEGAADAAAGDATAARDDAAARDDGDAGDAPAAGGAEDASGAGDAGPRIPLAEAVRGLDPAEREIIDLHLAHGLEAAEIATVLGVSRRRADSLISRASGQLDACMGVLLVGRATPAGCAQLTGMLAGWDGNLTPALRWWAHGHIKKCATCAGRRLAVLPGLSGGAAMAAAAVQSLRLAGGPPAALREHTLALAAGQDPSAVAYQAVLLSRAATAGRRGFPRAAARADRPAASRREARRKHFPAAADGRRRLRGARRRRCGGRGRDDRERHPRQAGRRPAAAARSDCTRHDCSGPDRCPGGRACP